MNQERFDELTRALATTQLSRWQVLKALFVSTIVASPLSGLASPSSAAPQRKAATAVPCADDPVTSASLDAARSALVAGATQVRLSPKGCMRYRRTLKGGRVTSEVLTLEGKPILMWKHTPAESTGQRDTDLDGFFEWRSTVQLGEKDDREGSKDDDREGSEDDDREGSEDDDRVVTTEYSPATKKLTRRTTYTRTSDGWHVLIEEVDQSGTLVTVAEFDTGLSFEGAATPSDQGSGGALPNGASGTGGQAKRQRRKPKPPKPKSTPSEPKLIFRRCTPEQEKQLRAAREASRNVGIACLEKYEQFWPLALMAANYTTRTTVLICSDPGKNEIGRDALAETGASSVLGGRTIFIEFNSDPDAPGYFFGFSPREQASMFFHEMLHLRGIYWSHEPGGCDADCVRSGNRAERDRTYACENLCFGTSSNSGEVTKCSCDLCLGRPGGQQCNEACRSFGKCRTAAGEKRCTFEPKPEPNPGGESYCCICGYPVADRKCYKTKAECLSSKCGVGSPGCASGEGRCRPNHSGKPVEP
jgi:hypothetical protein